MKILHSISKIMQTLNILILFIGFISLYIFGMREPHYNESFIHNLMTFSWQYGKTFIIITAFVGAFLISLNALNRIWKKDF